MCAEDAPPRCPRVACTSTECILDAGACRPRPGSRSVVPSLPPGGLGECEGRARAGPRRPCLSAGAKWEPRGGQLLLLPSLAHPPGLPGWPQQGEGRRVTAETPEPRSWPVRSGLRRLLPRPGAGPTTPGGLCLLGRAKGAQEGPGQRRGPVGPALRRARRGAGSRRSSAANPKLKAPPRPPAGASAAV